MGAPLRKVFFLVESPDREIPAEGTIHLDAQGNPFFEAEAAYHFGRALNPKALSYPYLIVCAQMMQFGQKPSLQQAKKVLIVSIVRL